MKQSELFPHSFTALRRSLGLGGPHKPLIAQMRSNASAFCRALVVAGLLTDEQMRRAADHYRLGMNREGGVIFWQIDEHGCLRDGKLMHYRPDCHRDHDRHPTWVSSILKRLGQLPEAFNPERCLFGLHLLAGDGEGSPVAERCCSATSKDDGVPYLQMHSTAKHGCTTAMNRPIAVVESEKTAVILSEAMPQYIWLAAGGLSMLSAEKLLPLQGRRVVLFPDTDPDGKAYAAWLRVAEEASERMQQPIHVSRLLEDHATDAQKAAKIDIADFLFCSP